MVATTIQFGGEQIVSSLSGTAGLADENTVNFGGEVMVSAGGVSRFGIRFGR